MAKGSSNKVARAAAAGRGRRTASAKQRSLLFPVSIGLVVVLGLVLIFVSRENNQDAATVPPAIGDHWHAAYGIYVCDQFLPPLTDRPDATVHNIHTHGDGLIHIHPFSSAAAGERAVFEVFADTTGLEVSTESIEYPGMDKVSAGDDCNGEPGVVKLAFWDATSVDQFDRATAWADEPAFWDGDPTDFKPSDNQLVTLAFVPEGAEVPQPPSVGGLAAPADETAPPGATPPPPTPTTAPAADEGDDAGTTETTAAGTTETTAAGTTETTAGP